MTKQWINTMLRIWIVLLSISTPYLAHSMPAFDNNGTASSTAVSQNNIASSEVHASAMTENKARHCQDLQNQLQCDHQCGNCVSCAIAPPDLGLYATDHYPVPYDYHKNLVFTDLEQQLKPPRV